MSLELDLSGLERLQRNLQKVDGEHQVKLTDLMPDDFISEAHQLPDSSGDA